MLYSSILSVFSVLSFAFASCVCDPRNDYTGLTRLGFPYPYICDEDQTKKVQGRFLDLPKEEQKHWVRTYFSVAHPAFFRGADESDKMHRDYAECLGFVYGSENYNDLIEGERYLLGFKEQKALHQVRVENGKEAERKVQRWRKTHGLPLLKKENAT